MEVTKLGMFNGFEVKVIDKTAIKGPMGSNYCYLIKGRDRHFSYRTNEMLNDEQITKLCA